MPTPIRITIGDTALKAELNDSTTAAAVVDILPTTIALSRWGDEYYGGCEVSAQESDDAREIITVGEIAFWPPGRALCIFFGPTPASTDDRPRAASNVNPIGRVLDDTAALSELGASIQAHLEKL